MDDLLLTGRVVAVTGGGEGIGRATVTRAAALGATVAVLDLEPPTETDAALAVRCDVADAASVERALAQVRDELGPVGVLVNNAGVARTGGFEDMPEESWDRTFAVNLKALFLCARAALPQLRAGGAGANIVNLASSAARWRSMSGDVAYAASKGGVLPFTRQLAHELGADGIRVNAVCPGGTDTGFARRALTGEELERVAANVPLGRLARPEEIAAVVCFLASDAASFMTGAIVDVNGGVI